VKMHFIIGSLATTLIGCSCPQQSAVDDCTDAKGFACLDKLAASPRIEWKPEVFKPEPVTKSARTTTGTKMENRSTAKLDDRVDSAAQKMKAASVARVAAPPSAPPGDKPDPVINQAKSSIAAKMEDPASVEFVEMKRAVRKNTLGQPIDTICGHVKGKTTSGQDTGERPFIYIVKENDAYVVDGGGDLTAASVYRNICN
jgi:hypothetical protein